MADKDDGQEKFEPYALLHMVGRPTSREAPPFGKRLAHFREKKGLTQAQLAEELGVSQQLVAYYERRATNPSLGFIETAAETLGVTVAELIGATPIKKDATKKRGPKSQLDERFERVRKLPRAKQQLVARMIDAVLAEPT